MIVRIDLPSVIDPNAGPVNGTVRFEDADGDIVQANFEAVSGNITGSSFDPDVFGRASGSFDFFVDCRGNTEDYVLAVTLEDQQGNTSNAELVEFSCRATAECGNGTVESGEVCDPPGASGGCGSGMLCTNDCSGACRRRRARAAAVRAATTSARRPTRSATATRPAVSSRTAATTSALFRLRV